MEKILKAIKAIKKSGYYPETPVVSTPHKPKVIVNGKEMLMFASNNYLGMTTDKRVAQAAIDGVKKWGIGNGSARLLTGNLDFHQKLEQDIANFKKRESALTFVAGYLVNEACIPAITNVMDLSVFKRVGLLKHNSSTVIFSDEYNHASIVVGVKLAGAEKEIYKHNDMNDLECKLKKYSLNRRKLIVTDGVFSMDGDIVNLPEVVALAKKYNAMIYLDDAHATGILGPNGRGTEDYFNMEGEVDFVMGTFTKAFGGVGGFIASKKEVIDYLRITAKGFIFTAPIAPPVACGLIKAIEIVKKEKNRRIKLLQNAEYFRGKLNELGYNTLKSQTQVIPVLLGNEVKAKKFSKYLLDNKIFVPVAQWPAVPRGMARLRFALMHEHSKKQIDYLLEIMSKAKNKFKI